MEKQSSTLLVIITTLRNFEDTTKFKILNKDPIVYRESLLQRRLFNCQKKGLFYVSQYEKVYHSGSKPARIYGLPKTLDDFPSFRPIISLPWALLITTEHHT